MTESAVFAAVNEKAPIYQVRWEQGQHGLECDEKHVAVNKAVASKHRNDEIFTFQVQHVPKNEEVFFFFFLCDFTALSSVCAVFNV